MNGSIEVVLWHGEAILRSFHVDRSTRATLAVAEVHRQIAAAANGCSFSSVSYAKRRSSAGQTWRLTEHTWPDALRNLVPASSDAARRFDRLELRVLFDSKKSGFKAAVAPTAVNRELSSCETEGSDGPSLPSCEGHTSLAVLGSQHRRRAVGGRSRALGCRVATKNTQGSERRGIIPEIVTPPLMLPCSSSVDLSPSRSEPCGEDCVSIASIAEFESFTFICEDEALRFVDVTSNDRGKAVDGRASASLQVVDAPALEICDALSDMGGCEAVEVSVSKPGSVADDDEWDLVDM